jgi:hypothetical protein
MLITKEIKETLRAIHSLIDVDYGNEYPKTWDIKFARIYPAIFTLRDALQPVYHWLIVALFLAACGLTVVQADGWGKFYCSGSLCVKYRTVDRKQFCRIYNFKASYRKATPILVVFVLPQKNSCQLVLNSITQDETKKLGRKYDLINVEKGDFNGKKNG